MPDLTVRQLSYTYPRRRGTGILAAREMSFDLPAGTTVGLIGPNGAGKTTAAKMLNGILKPDAGRILMGQNPIRPDRSPGGVVAYAFQNPDHQLFATSVRDELEFGPRNLGLPPKTLAERVNAAAELVGLAERLESHPLDLPFVLRKRVSIAAALAMDRPWTILDEPTLGQDHRFRLLLSDTFCRLRAAGRGVILISHDPEFLFECCEWIILLVEGRVAFEGRSEDYAAQEGTGQRFLFRSVAMRVGARLPAVAPVSCLRKLRARLTATGLQE